MSDSPYIHPFKTSEQCYFYDVNTDKILKIPEPVYDFLSNQNNSQADEATRSFIQDLKENGFLRTDRVEVSEHPATFLLPYYLKNKMHQLILQVTQCCNLRCSYCTYSGSYKNRLHSNSIMTIETAEQAIDFFMKRTKDIMNVSVSFYGGEPMLNLALIKHCVDYIKKRYYGKSIDFGMTTNGTLLDVNSITFLANNRFDLIISLDGPKEIHDKNRRFAKNGEGSFSVIMDNIGIMKSLYPSYYQEYVRFNAVSDAKQILSCFNEFISDEEVLDEKKFMLNYVTDHYTERKIDIDDDFFIDREYEVFKFFLSKMGEYPKEKTSYLLNSQFARMYIHCFKDIDIEQECIPRKFHHGGPCIPGVTRLFVDTSGRLFPCERVSELSETVMLGDVNKGISLIKATEVLNIESTTHSKCKNCWVYRQCSICVARADDMQNVSAVETNKMCPTVCRSMEEIFKDYCVLRELGYSFNEERLQGEK